MTNEAEIKKLENEIVGLKAAADRKKKKIEELKRNEAVVANKTALERTLGMKFDKKTYSMPEVIDICMKMNGQFDLLLKQQRSSWTAYEFRPNYAREDV